MRFHSAREEILDLLYPACCLGCGAHGGYLCERCLARLSLLAEERGAGPRPPGGDRSAVSGVRAASAYQGLVRDMILRLKSSVRPLAGPLGRLMAAAAGNDPDYLFADLVCFVPSERAKVALRGYNPAEVLAEVVALHTGRPLRAALEKARRTRDQDSVSGEHRWNNVERAFHLRPGSVSGARVLLVDDVLTTGATAEWCARALLDGGARSVHVLVAARSFLRDSQGGLGANPKIH